MSEPPAADPYRRVDYRRLVAWPARIEREAPFLRRVLAGAPDKSVLDLGCATGEHTDFLAAEGLRAVGIDRSESFIEQARDYEGGRGETGPRFLLGDLTRLPELTTERFGGAICLGNALPHFEDDDLDLLLTGLARRLLPGASLLIQILNYERILGQAIRHLPLNFRKDPGEPGEIVFLRLMTPDGPRHVRFNPLTLALRPGGEPPVELKTSREVRLRAWTRPELERELQEHGFRVTAVHGDMTGGAYEGSGSSDLVIVARFKGDRL